MFSCGSPKPASSQRKRAPRAGTEAPRATIQRSASSGGLLRRNGGSVRTKLCDAEQHENLNAGLSVGPPSWSRADQDAAMGPRSPLSALTVNSPESTISSPGLTRTDMSVLEAFSLDKPCSVPATAVPAMDPRREQLLESLQPGSAAKYAIAAASPKTPTVPATATAVQLPPPPPLERMEPHPPAQALAPRKASGGGKPPLPKFVKPERVPHGHVISEDETKVCAACRREIGSHGGGCFFAFDRVFCTSFCQQRFIEMAAHAKASRRQPPQGQFDGRLGGTAREASLF